MLPRTYLGVLCFIIANIKETGANPAGYRNTMNATSLVTLVACEGQKAFISCPNVYDATRIVSTMFGRENRHICVHPKLPSSKICQEQATTVDKAIRDLCEGENRCEVAATNDFLAIEGTIICPRVYKYLQIQYKCIPKSTIPLAPVIEQGFDYDLRQSTGATRITSTSYESLKLDPENRENGIINKTKQIFELKHEDDKVNVVIVDDYDEDITNSEKIALANAFQKSTVTMSNGTNHEDVTMSLKDLVHIDNDDNGRVSGSNQNLWQNKREKNKVDIKTHDRDADHYATNYDIDVKTKLVRLASSKSHLNTGENVIDNDDISDDRTKSNKRIKLSLSQKSNIEKQRLMSNSGIKKEHVVIKEKEEEERNNTKMNKSTKNSPQKKHGVISKKLKKINQNEDETTGVYDDGDDDDDDNDDDDVDDDNDDYGGDDDEEVNRVFKTGRDASERLIKKILQRKVENTSFVKNTAEFDTGSQKNDKEFKQIGQNTNVDSKLGTYNSSINRYLPKNVVKAEPGITRKIKCHKELENNVVTDGVNAASGDNSDDVKHNEISDDVTERIKKVPLEDDFEDIVDASDLEV